MTFKTEGEYWLNSLRSIVICDMMSMVDVLGHPDLNDNVFRYAIGVLENGMDFFERERLERERQVKKDED